MCFATFSSGDCTDIESHDHAIRFKAEIMVDQLSRAGYGNKNRIGGKARAMVVTSGIEWAIQYFQAFRNYLAERKSLYLAIVAFSGVHEYDGAHGARRSSRQGDATDPERRHAVLQTVR